jgi:hypothetical protein
MLFLPVLQFSRIDGRIFLHDRESGKVYFSYPAHNVTDNPEGDPLQAGSGAPAPAGFLCISPPDFISAQFQMEFYRDRIEGPGPMPGESLVQGWGEFCQEEMGRVRFALGNPNAPAGSGDRAAWDRELLVHGGGWFHKPTRGCIRMADSDMEDLAAQVIRARRSGLVISNIFVGGKS